MEWEIKLSRQAEKFLKRNHLAGDFVADPVRKAILKLEGEVVSIDLKQLSGEWRGCYRVRIGRNRIIFSISFEARTILIEVVDNRGSAYR